MTTDHNEITPVRTSPVVTFVCPMMVGHPNVTVPLADVQRMGLTGAVPRCRECAKQMRQRSVRGDLPTIPNHHRVSILGLTPPIRNEAGVVQCDACVVGDHGRCVGVRCFCSVSPSTSQAHHAQLTPRECHGA